MVVELMNCRINIIFASLMIGSCSSQPQDIQTKMPRHDMDTTTHKHTNRLINETSPYLLQHAHNPVNWFPWGDEALETAKAENKLLLISIGYSACHWCHVMERESFEDEEVAGIMNENFVCIKVDREERPDIDMTYMSAVQLVSGSGGWPLNCFALPDGRPVTGGTYFPKEQWKETLLKISSEYKKNPVAFLRYAETLTNGVNTSDLIDFNNDETDFSPDELADGTAQWKEHFDNTEGGSDQAPKFPLPAGYIFLLRYGYLSKDEAVLKHVKLTLQKMAYGGIYDHIGGGFARYSTDKIWKVPHFEKMLYDNAQLVSLYAEAYQATKNPLYKTVVYETLDFIKREMTSPEGVFYSSLDADSEGEEGKYYVWKKEELQEVLGERFNLFADYFNINEHGLWENDSYILLKKEDDDVIAARYGISVEKLKHEINEAKNILLNVRSKRKRPGLDDKSLISWNALMAKGYLDAFSAFNEKSFLEATEKNIRLLLTRCRMEDGGLYHAYKNGKATIPGFLEDYSFVIETLIGLYEATFDAKWLIEAGDLAEYAIRHFYDDSTAMFFFTSGTAQQLISRKSDAYDNVIPSSNSSMAKALFYLGNLLDNPGYLKISRQMLNNMRNHIGTYPSGYSNWTNLMLHHVYSYYEVAIVGKDAMEKREELIKYYLPNKILLGSMAESKPVDASIIKVPLLDNKFVEGKTLVYVCEDRVCKMSVESIDEAIKLLKEK